MANRRFEQFQLGLEKAVVNLYGQVAIGAAGAPTLTLANSKGMASMTRISTGRYQINLQDAYQRLMMFDYGLVIATGAPGSGNSPEAVVRADNTKTTTPNIVIEFLDGTGVATELASGVTVLFQLQLKNSQV